MAIALGLGACTRPTPPTERLAFDATRTGTQGANGKYQVLHTTILEQARVEESITLDVTYAVPVDETPLPLVVFVQGAPIAVGRYQWLFDHVASRGYTVVAPVHFTDIAFLQADNAQLALDASIHAGLADRTTKTAVIGHSYGGVIAAYAFAQEPRFDGLALLASLAGPSELSQRERSVLGIAGSNDQKWREGQVRFGVLRYSAPRFFGVVSGMNHMAWADDPTERELAEDGPLSGDLPRVRKEAMHFLDAWLDATLRDDAAARADLIAIAEQETSAP